MSGERSNRAIDGQYGGWIGPVRSYLGVLTPSDVTVYDPPIRLLRASSTGVAGNVVLVYDGDDETVAGNYDTRAVAPGDDLDKWAIRQVRATGTTATIIKGYR